MAESKIEWTDVTWNPVTGCDKVSAGCKNCYAEKMAHRLKAMGQPKYARGFEVTLHWDELEKPLTWKKPSMVFVNSMSDLFHEDVPEAFIESVFRVMVDAKQHTFQVLTKRSGRLREMAPRLPWPENVWMGVSVEDRDALERLIDLYEVPARVWFCSFEPLLGPVVPDKDLAHYFECLDWAVVGGESGPGARPMEEAWVLEIRDLCIERGIPFFFKQWGGVNKMRAGRELEGRTWDEMPERTVGR